MKEGEEDEDVGGDTVEVVFPGELKAGEGNTNFGE